MPIKRRGGRGTIAIGLIISRLIPGSWMARIKRRGAMGDR
jgi:hypothetical protein